MEATNYPRQGLKTRTIRERLSKKFNDFLASIEDVDLRDLVKENSIITGGAIASMLLGERVNDYDVYFTNVDTALRVAQYYTKKFNDLNNPDLQPIADLEDDRVVITVTEGIVSEDTEIVDDPSEAEDIIEQHRTAAGTADSEKPQYRPVFLSTNAITLSDGVQLVVRFYGDPDKIHENYDFVHCTNYWTSKDNKLTLRTNALASLLSRELRYVGSKYPVASIVRMRKFIQRGWRIHAGEILKMIFQTNELDLNNREVLRDQLVGIDMVYFRQVISQINDKTDLSAAYLCEIVERMYGDGVDETSIPF